ncbi:MAG: PQQ-binding-like beta-propeller repeat protein [Verrucomicrobia bacterium]|nr:PQQ-binding-like beta-propeller repeat protein [Verrucomicrobiota bacterium]
MKLVLSILLLSCTVLLAGENWPQFRGPLGDGTTQDANIPTTWSEDKNVVWKTAIHGRGWSSPVIYGKQVWLTTATPDGKELSVLCLDKESGKILLDRKLFDIAEPQFAHKFNTYASPTPVIEEGKVYVTFGSPGTACLDTETFKVLWTREDIVCDHFRGAGSSAILYEDLLILNYDGADYQFVMAFDKQTGKTRWKTQRSVDFKDLKDDGKPKMDGDLRKAYATPHVATLGGRKVLISQGAMAIYGYDPKSGEELWRFDEHSNHSASTRPVISGDTIYLPTGFAKPYLVALSGKLEGVLDESVVKWKVNKDVPKMPSLQLVGNHVYAVSDKGTATCWDAETGEVQWSERIRGQYSASPIVSKDRIYFFGIDGKTRVVKAGSTFELLAENVLDEGGLASPAVSGASLYLRTKTHLYCIRK